jgi:hypothetical protein
VFAESRFNIDPNGRVSINFRGDWKTMNDIKDYLYIDRRSGPGNPLRCLGVSEDKKDFIQFRLYIEPKKQLQIFPQNFPPTCPSRQKLGESSGSNLSTSTDLGIIREIIPTTKANEPNKYALQYYPLSGEPTSSWGVLTGRIEGRNDDIVAYIWSSAYYAEPREYSLQFRRPEVSTKDFIVRTNDVTV